ncbi:hypothetical protein niasHT_003135 [Heterodera trifolii]|uniref:Uncharacterized protein n=1 Tax=Heterodera trifolii TaxID=157864 RepID=A0ABD2M549_9BILA
MAKRILLRKRQTKNARQTRVNKREERSEKTEMARQARWVKKTVQQQQIDDGEGEAETEQQEMDQAEQVEVTYDHPMYFDFQLENYVQMSPNLAIDDQQQPAWGATAEAGVQCATQTTEASTQTGWSINAAGNSALYEANFELQHRVAQLRKQLAELQRTALLVHEPEKRPNEDDDKENKTPLGRPKKRFAEKKDRAQRADPSMTITPSLHIIACQGVFFGIFKELRHLCSRHGTEYEEQLEMRLRALGAYKNAWYQEYSGYHVRNILRGGGPMHVTEFLPQSPRRDNILMALELLAKLQSFAVADLLSADQIADFRATADQFRVHMLEHFRRHCSTSKFHHLVHHAPEFAKKHGFWGLLSEQPVEKFHALFNDDLARKANTKDLHDILMFCARESAIRNAIFDANQL